jgi:D-alanyl-D-alanine carboxypeptidase
VVVALGLGAGPVARAQTSSNGLAPKASILVDADTGAVLDGTNIHTPLPPASLSKIFTALTAVANLDPHTSIPVSARAAGMPAHNLNMKQGQVWQLEDVLGSLLVSSANDAGMALAERVSGTAEAFGDALSATATRIGLADDPQLRDPSGLDDEFSVGGGNRVSARDLAIAARAVLAEPRLAPIVASAVYSFTGGDGIAHRLGNHNRLLKVYPGAIGMKTGYTKRSLHSLVGAATRNGRTMIAVILNHPGETYTPVSAMLDRGFAMPVSAEPTSDILPAVPTGAAARQPAATAPSGASQLGSQQAVGAGTVKVAAPDPKRTWVGALGVFLLKVLLGFAATVAILRIRVRVKTAQKTAQKTEGRERVAQVDLRDRPAVPAALIRTRPLPVVRAPAHMAPRQRPLRAKRAGDTAPEIDPRLAQRFEILVRTGQVVP